MLDTIVVYLHLNEIHVQVSTLCISYIVINPNIKSGFYRHIF